MTAKARSPRTEAQKRAYQELVPAPHTNAAGPSFIDPELVGKQLVYLKLGIAMEYTRSFYVADGELCHAGVICSKAHGCGIALGDEWCRRAEELLTRMVVKS